MRFSAWCSETLARTRAMLMTWKGWGDPPFVVILLYDMFHMGGMWGALPPTIKHSSSIIRCWECFHIGEVLWGQITGFFCAGAQNLSGDTRVVQKMADGAIIGHAWSTFVSMFRLVLRAYPSPRCIGWSGVQLRSNTWIQHMEVVQKMADGATIGHARSRDISICQCSSKRLRIIDRIFCVDRT